MADFIPLSAHIAGVTDQTIEIPDYLNVALDRVISVRTSFSKKLEEAGRNIDQASDSRHNFFVTVLERVRESLKPLMKTDALDLSSIKNAIPKTDGNRARQSGLRNIFEVLDVYEPSAEFLAAPNVVPPPKPTELEYTVEVSTDSVMDACIAMTMLMDDFSRLRAEIADLWARHNEGELDLTTVSVATDTAIQLAHSLEDEVYPLMKSFVENSSVDKTDFNSPSFHHRYWMGVSSEAGYNTNSFSDDYNLNGYDIADALFINSRNGLLAFLASYHPGRVLDYNGKWGRFNENARAPRSNREKYARDKSALQEFCQDIPLLSNRPGVVEDQFVRGFAAAQKLCARDTATLPLWVCFAFQIYLDILYSTAIGAGWTEMRNEVNKLQGYVEAYPKASSDMNKMVRSIDRIMEIDPIAVIRQAFDSPYRDHTFWRRNPTHCGLWIHYARTVFHREAVKYAATPGAVMCTTQLYHAFRQKQLLSEEWKDLQTLWDMQGNSTYFIGEPPEDFEGLWKNYLLSIGASATNWATGKRNTKVKETKANARQMKFKGPISSWMSSRIATKGDERLITAEAIENAIVESERHHSALASAAPTIRKQSHVITKPATALQAEAPEITFDYFTMHDLCWELLERMKEQFRPIIAQKSGKQWEAQKSNLPFVVGFVFSTAAGKGGIETNGVPSEELLSIAVGVTKRFLEEGKGNVITDGEQNV